MDNLVKRLEKKGWGKREIKKAVGIIRNAKQDNSPNTKFLDKKIYWILLIIVSAANFAISIALIPILLSLSGAKLYFIVSVLGVTFGLLFELVIRSIEHLQRYHHILLAFLIPIVSMASLLIIANISNNAMVKLSLNNIHNSFFVVITYAVSFVAPYIIYRFVLKIEYYAKE